MRILRCFAVFVRHFRHLSANTSFNNRCCVVSVRLWLGKIRPNLLCRYVSCNQCFRSLRLWRAERSCTFVGPILGWTPESGVLAEYLIPSVVSDRAFSYFFIWFLCPRDSSISLILSVLLSHSWITSGCDDYLTQLMDGTEIGWSRSPLWLWFHLLKYADRNQDNWAPDESLRVFLPKIGPLFYFYKANIAKMLLCFRLKCWAHISNIWRSTLNI